MKSNANMINIPSVTERTGSRDALAGGASFAGAALADAGAADALVSSDSSPRGAPCGDRSAGTCAADGGLTADLRESVFYGFPPGGDLAPAWESFSAFNSSGPRIEWRIETENGRAAPYAAIHRWFVSSDAENPDRKIEVLVVEKVGRIDQREGCTVGLVLATGNPKANEAARKIADEKARGFACGTDERVVVGSPMPDFSRSEN